MRINFVSNTSFCKTEHNSVSKDNHSPSYCCRPDIPVNFKSLLNDEVKLPAKITRTLRVPQRYAAVRNTSELKKALEANRNVILMNDITFADDEVWTPVGDSNKPFTKILDGNGYKISNLKIVPQKNSSFDYTGLIGVASDKAVIKNLILENADIKASGSSVAVGAIAGMLTDFSKVWNCCVQGKIEAVSCVGGITGMNTYNSKIGNCKVIADISGKGDIGGIAGFNAMNSIIDSSKFKGTINGEGKEIGGIVGYNIFNSVVYHCKSDAKVQGDDEYGGLAGKNTNSSSIQKCVVEYDLPKNASRHSGIYVGINSADSPVKDNEHISDKQYPDTFYFGYYG